MREVKMDDKDVARLGRVMATKREIAKANAECEARMMLIFEDYLKKGEKPTNYNVDTGTLTVESDDDRTGNTDKSEDE